MSGLLKKRRERGGRGRIGELRTIIHAGHAMDLAVAATRGAGEGGSITGVPTHGGDYILYNIFGNLFEVSAKYVLPIRLIGHGAYGIVCSAFNTETQEEVAIKKIGNAFDNRTTAMRILREISLLRHMEHENVIAIRDIIRPPVRDDFKDVYIVFELMDSDLDQIIRSNQPLTDAHCQYFLYQLLRGLKYLQSANVLHRDLKPSNLFVDFNCDLKIGDFGLARTSPENELMTESVVTHWYRAPEILLRCNHYTGAIDVWSVGCIYMEMLNRETLFRGRDPVHQLNLITQLIGSPDDSDLGFLRNDHARRYLKKLETYPRQPLGNKYPHMNMAAADLMERILVFDPNKRITVEEALDHPYLANLHDMKDEPVCQAPLEFDFEQAALTEERIRELVMTEALVFNPMPDHTDQLQ